MTKLKDGDIRILLKQKITSIDEFASDLSTRIIDEFDVCFGSARADVAVVNGKIHGFEIKSESDNLDRLPSQVEFYNRVFDTITLVVSKVHLSRARNLIPKWWGLECVIHKNSEIALKTIRTPKNNTKVILHDLTQLLWKDELLELLECNGITKGVKSKTRFQLGELAVDKLNNADISGFVRKKLKSRESWRAVSIQQLYDDLQIL